MSSSSGLAATVANVVESEIYRIPNGRHKTHYKEQEGEELKALNKVYQYEQQLDGFLEALKGKLTATREELVQRSGIRPLHAMDHEMSFTPLQV